MTMFLRIIMTLEDFISLTGNSRARPTSFRSIAENFPTYSAQLLVICINYLVTKKKYVLIKQESHSLSQSQKLNEESFRQGQDKCYLISPDFFYYESAGVFCHEEKTLDKIYDSSIVSTISEGRYNGKLTSEIFSRESMKSQTLYSTLDRFNSLGLLRKSVVRSKPILNNTDKVKSRSVCFLLDRFQTMHLGEDHRELDVDLLLSIYVWISRYMIKNEITRLSSDELMLGFGISKLNLLYLKEQLLQLSESDFLQLTVPLQIEDESFELISYHFETDSFRQECDAVGPFRGICSVYDHLDEFTRVTSDGIVSSTIRTYFGVGRKRSEFSIKEILQNLNYSQSSIQEGKTIMQKLYRNGTQSSLKFPLESIIRNLSCSEVRVDCGSSQEDAKNIGIQNNVNFPLANKYSEQRLRRYACILEFLNEVQNFGNLSFLYMKTQNDVLVGSGYYDYFGASS